MVFIEFIGLYCVFFGLYPILTYYALSGLFDFEISALKGRNILESGVAR
jgi:hypothetical protein